jgi:hypothetical protein
MHYSLQLQKHIAWCSVGPTTLRRMVPIGGRRAICQWMSEVELKTLSDDGVEITLNKWTSMVMSDLNFAFGPARKSLNLFLRELDYNNWTRDHFNFPRMEHDLEVPLDGIVMRCIRHSSCQVLREVSVVGLTSSDSTHYQDAAAEIAKKKGTLRVHLDVEWWSGD